MRRLDHTLTRIGITISGFGPVGWSLSGHSQGNGR
jgi:hypothetical protein